MLNEIFKAVKTVKFIDLGVMVLRMSLTYNTTKRVSNRKCIGAEFIPFSFQIENLKSEK